MISVSSHNATAILRGTLNRVLAKNYGDEDGDETRFTSATAVTKSKDWAAQISKLYESFPIFIPIK